VEFASCVLCDAESTAHVVTTQSYVHPAPGRGGERFAVVRCRSCGLMFTNPRPTEDEIGPYYVGYSVHDPGDQAADVPLAPRPRAPGLLARALGLGNPGLPELPAGARVLEIGCAAGAFLASLRDRGWCLEGIEPSPTAAAYARDVRGLDVRCGTIETVDLPEAAFDLVFAWHVVEHFAHPVRTLTAIRRVLKPGGLLCLSLPNAGAIEARIFGSYWGAWDPPLHYYHFTPASISAVLEKAGFAVTDIQHQRNVANIAQSLGAFLRDRRAGSALGRYLLRFGEGVPHEATITAVTKPLAVLLAAMRQGGRITVVGRRR